ncbi:MAG: OmpA family protein, partial [Armatimonadetes bacterium]|nr:OmpA family protein [Armatimonadota bacterium]
GVLNRFQGMYILVDGHTDSVGDPASNLRLSQDRAESVRKALINRGIESSRVVARGYGDKKPVGANDTEAGRALNRRIECKVVKAKER